MHYCAFELKGQHGSGQRLVRTVKSVGYLKIFRPPSRQIVALCVSSPILSRLRESATNRNVKKA